MLHHLVQVNYAPVSIMILLGVFIITNHYFDSKVKKISMIVLSILFLITMADAIEHVTSSFEKPTVLRIVMSAIGYSLRPAGLFFMLVFVLRRREVKWGLLAIPLVINTILAFSALFTDVAYAYSETNEFIRGPLGYFAFVTSGVYGVMLLVYAIKTYNIIDVTETYNIALVMVLMVIASYMESVPKYEGVIVTAGALAILFYFLYFNTQKLKRDVMTNALNRRCLYIDAERNKSTLDAVVSIDLNNLKQLNDEQGHAEGDKAICTLADCVHKALVKGCYFYRVGGDEFMVLCFRMSKKDVEKFVDKVNSNMAKTPYTCAIGMVYVDNHDMVFEKLCSMADKAMYEKKFSMKSK